MAENAFDIQTSTTTKGKTTGKKANNVVVGLGNLVKVLPSGTFFLYTFLNPILTNNGKCQTGHKYATSIFLGICGLSSCFSWFTDSYVDNNGVTQYGIVTTKGLLPLSDSESSVDLSKYKLRVGDLVHAFISVVVFALVALLDPNTVECFYPSFESSQKTLVMVLPPVIGAIASSAFVAFPNKRNGIGHPPSPSNASPPS